MKFIDLNQVLATSRRFVAGAANVQDEEVKNPTKLADILRKLMRRISDVESLTPPEAMEFEVECSEEGILVELCHNMNSPVRFYVVFWTKLAAGTVYPSLGPVLVADETSTPDILYLRSYTTGRAIIRVEPAFKGIAYNQE